MDEHALYQQAEKEAKAVSITVARKPDGSIACLGDGEMVPAWWLPLPNAKYVIIRTNYAPMPDHTYEVYLPVPNSRLESDDSELENMLIDLARRKVQGEIFNRLRANSVSPRPL